MQCNALNIKTVAKQVWFYFIRGTTRPGYAGANPQIVLNTPKNPYLNQATQKNTCQTFPTQKNPEIENFKPQKPFDHPCHLKSGVQPPPGPFYFYFCQKMEFRTDFFSYKV